ncbi:MAG: NF038122 family metalloprotease [Sphingobium sp.]|nr:NF038122 family metalloprotease [Sphingobium sp.]
MAMLALGLSAPSQAGLTFNFTFTAGTSDAAKNAFIAAGNIWSGLFNDNVTLDLTVGTAALGPGILGQAASRRINFSYSTFTTALAADIASGADATAVAHLQPGDNFGMVMNLTSDNPNGSGSITPFIDDNNTANNRSLNITTANAKALGLGVGAGTVSGCTVTCDAFIQFSSNFAFDYDQSDGVSAGLYDFVGVAAHEIGHALGFVSGVDILDYNTPPRGGPYPSNAFTYVSALDLFRYSDLSVANGGLIDWSADTRAKFFSIDGGATKGSLFATGVYHGDGQQASHWKDSQGIGIMDPTAATGETLSVSGNDLLALDVIGWNVKVAAVPEPASWAMMIAGFALVGSGLRYRRRGLATA